MYKHSGAISSKAPYKRKSKKLKTAKEKTNRYFNNMCEQPLPKIIINLNKSQPSVRFSQVIRNPYKPVILKPLKKEKSKTPSTSPNVQQVVFKTIQKATTSSHSSEYQNVEGFINSNSVSAPTIADKVKLRKRGKGVVPVADLYNTIVESEAGIPPKSRKSRKGSLGSINKDPTFIFASISNSSFTDFNSLPFTIKKELPENEVENSSCIVNNLNNTFASISGPSYTDFNTLPFTIKKELPEIEVEHSSRIVNNLNNTFASISGSSYTDFNTLPFTIKKELPEIEVEHSSCIVNNLNHTFASISESSFADFNTLPFTVKKELPEIESQVSMCVINNLNNTFASRAQSSFSFDSANLETSLGTIMSTICDSEEHLNEATDSIVKFLENGVLSKGMSVSEDPLQTLDFPLMFDISKKDVLLKPNIFLNNVTETTLPKPILSFCVEPYDILDSESELGVASFEDAIEIPIDQMLPVKRETNVQELPASIIIKQEPKEFVETEAFMERIKPISVQTSAIDFPLIKSEPLDLPFIKSEPLDLEVMDLPFRNSKPLDVKEIELMLKRVEVPGAFSFVGPPLATCSAIFKPSQFATETKIVPETKSPVPFIEASPFKIGNQSPPQYEPASESHYSATSFSQHNVIESSASNPNSRNSWPLSEKNSAPKPNPHVSSDHKEYAKSFKYTPVKVCSQFGQHSSSKEVNGKYNLSDYCSKPKKRSHSRSRSHRSNSPRRSDSNKVRKSIYFGSSPLCQDDNTRTESQSSPLKSKKAANQSTTTEDGSGFYSEKERHKAMNERRVVYVGNIPMSYTLEQLKKRFSAYGAIEDIQLKSKDCDVNDMYLNSSPHEFVNGGNQSALNGKMKKYFGFVTYKYQLDATVAIERGNENAWPIFTLNFGGRRHFVGEDYTDLDGKVAQIEEPLYNSHVDFKFKPTGEEDDFALMLKQEQKRCGLTPSKSSTSRH